MVRSVVNGVLLPSNKDAQRNGKYVQVATYIDTIDHYNILLCALESISSAIILVSFSEAKFRFSESGVTGRVTVVSDRASTSAIGVTVTGGTFPATS